MRFPPPARESKTDRIGRAVFLVMVAFLAFVAGGLVMLAGLFPAGLLRDAYRAGEALVLQYQMTHDLLMTNLYQPARTTARGVTINDPARAYPGYTLYTSGEGAVTRLIAADGRIVHEWRRPFSTVWNEEAAVKDPQPDRLIYMDNARVFPNGDLLAIYISAGDTPWGYGLVKLDKDSNLLWSYLGHAHHDFDVAPDGRIFVLTNELVFEKAEGFEHLDTPWLDDTIVVLTPDGKEIRQISLTRAMMRSRFSAYLNLVPYFSLADPLHTNTVEYIDAAKARNFPFGREGDLLVSFRDIGVVAVLAQDTSTITWAVRGSWLRQHDPGILPNGDIMLFDNLGGLLKYNSSRIVEFDPRTLAIKWTYAADYEHPFDSVLRSSAQRLPNGNTLITESDGGRLFEITRGGEIVWEYVNPTRAGVNDEAIPIVSAGQRIDPATLDPGFREALEGRRSIVKP